MSRFIVWCPELGHESHEDGRELGCSDGEHAALEWAEREDSRSADYWIVGGEGTTVHVYDVAAETTETFWLSGEPTINYWARATTAAPGGAKQ